MTDRGDRSSLAQVNSASLLLPDFSPASRSTHVPTVTLAEVSVLTQKLAQRIRDANFQPNLIVYVETGARLIAWQLCTEFAVKAVAVTARRPGHGLKQSLAGLVRLLPKAVTNRLRRWEERSGIHGRSERHVVFPEGSKIAAGNILLVDDASDTGRTLVAVREELIRRGADAKSLRTAVLAATTPAAQQLVDFYLLNENSCLPWSADSSERAAALASFDRCRPPHA
jgi:hypoxanthine phosphoribosyltransferase